MRHYKNPIVNCIKTIFDKLIIDILMVINNPYFLIIHTSTRIQIIHISHDLPYIIYQFLLTIMLTNK